MFLQITYTVPISMASYSQTGANVQKYTFFQCPLDAPPENVSLIRNKTVLTSLPKYMSKENRKHTIIGVGAILIVVALLLYIITGHSKKREIKGTWIADTTNVETGFQCGDDGLAASIGNPTCQYNSWELHKGNLILKGKLFHDYHVEEIADTFRIISLSQSQLTVNHNGTVTRYVKTR